MTWCEVRGHKTAICGINLASRQFLFGFLALANVWLAKCLKFLKNRLPTYWEILLKCPDFNFLMKNQIWPPGALIPTWQHWLPRLNGHVIFPLPQPQCSQGPTQRRVPIAAASPACFAVFLTPDSFLSFVPYRHGACGLHVDEGKEYCWTLSRSEHSLRAVICMNTVYIKSSKTKPKLFIMEHFKHTPK